MQGSANRGCGFEEGEEDNLNVIALFNGINFPFPLFWRSSDESYESDMANKKVTLSKFGNDFILYVVE